MDLIILSIIVFLIRLLFVWQGLDFTDMGFWLTGYQQFYDHPDSIGSPACWLSFFIGHWIGVFTGGTIIAYKVSDAVVAALIASICFRLLSIHFTNRTVLGAVILLTSIYTKSWGGNWLDYNGLTALFYFAAAALMYHGLIGNRPLLIGLSGLILGANLFIRLPNVLGIACVLIIPLHAWSMGKPPLHAIRRAAIFLLGFSAGIVLIWVLIVFSNHDQIYIQGIQSLLNDTTSSRSSHRGSSLIKTFIVDHITAFGTAFFFLNTIVLIAFNVNRLNTHIARITVVSGALLVALYLLRSERAIWLIPGICYIVLCCITILNFRKNPPLSLLAVLSTAVMILTPLGSDNGIANAIFGIWMALPLTLAWRPLNKDLNFSIYSFSHETFRMASVTVSLVLLFYSVIVTYRHTYIDSNNRLSMTYSVKHPLLVGTFTTRERATVVEELLSAMTDYVKPGDQLLSYNAIPTIHYLTGTRPWLGKAWIDLLPAEKVAGLLSEKEKSRSPLPCIVRAKRSTYSMFWPASDEPPATFMNQDEVRREIDRFIQRNAYTVSWANDFFEILTPKHRQYGNI